MLRDCVVASHGFFFSQENVINFLEKEKIKLLLGVEPLHFSHTRLPTSGVPRGAQGTRPPRTENEGKKIIVVHDGLF